MKRKIAALLCCCLMMLQLAVPSAQAAPEIYFVAAGIEVQPLSDKTMPFWENGYLYIPASIFTGTVRKTLGISQVDSRDTLILYSAGDHSLMFDMTKTYTKSSEGTISTPGGIRRNGVSYVPVYLVAKYFGLEYSVTPVQNGYNGYLVWLRQPESGLTDTEFVNAALYSMAARYAEYQKNKGTADEVNETVSGSEGNGVITGMKIYLCLEANQLTGAAMDMLGRFGMQAAFFCTEEFLKEESDSLRRMVATGHTVGLLADAAENAEQVLEQLEEQNRLLEQATCGKTRLVYVRGGDENLLRELEAAGYSCLRPDLNRAEYNLRGESEATTLLQRVSSRRGDVSVWLGKSFSITGLRAFLDAAEEVDDLCLALTELI